MDIFGVGLRLLATILFLIYASAATALTCPKDLLPSYALIVDPTTSGGKLLAADFLRNGEQQLNPYHVSELSRISGQMGQLHFDPSLFVDGFVMDDDKEKARLIRTLKGLPNKPKVILAGHEEAVGFVDDIREALEHPYANVYALRDARFHKGKLGDVLEAAGIDHVEQAYSSNVEDLITWRIRKYGRFPVIVKPVDSAGTDHVKLCYSDREIREHFNKAMGTMSACHRPIREMVIQEVLDVKENEFVVDVVSEGGQHKVFIAGRLFHEPVLGGGFMVTDGEALDARDPQFADLIAYAFKVLDTLGWKNGPAHLEISRTGDKYKILDFNGRIAGTWPTVGRMAYGQDLMEWIRWSIVDKERFHALPQLPLMRQKSLFYVVRSKSDDWRFNENSAKANEEHLRQAVPSIHRYSQLKSPGAAFPTTINVYTMGAIIELSNSSPDRLRDDMLKLRRLDAAGFFQAQ